MLKGLRFYPESRCCYIGLSGVKHGEGAQGWKRNKVNGSNQLSKVPMAVSQMLNRKKSANKFQVEIQKLKLLSITSNQMKPIDGRLRMLPAGLPLTLICYLASIVNSSDLQ